MSNALKNPSPTGGTSGDSDSTDMTLSVSTSADGSCWDEDSEWALYFFLNDNFITSQGYVGYVHFYEKNSGDWKVNGAASGDPHLFTVTGKMDEDTGSTNKATVKIALKTDIKANYCTGSSINLNKNTAPAACTLPSSYTVQNICSVGIDSKNNYYYYYYDGYFTIGNAVKANAIGDLKKFDLPQGYSATEIVGMEIAASNDVCYVWFDDYTVWTGTANKITSKKGTYTLPSGQTPADIRAVGIAPPAPVGSGHCYYWFLDGTRSVGSSTNATKYNDYKAYTMPPGWTTTDIFGMAVESKQSITYTWLAD